MVLDINL